MAGIKAKIMDPLTGISDSIDDKITGLGRYINGNDCYIANILGASSFYPGLNVLK
jgi:hypothetical protein